MSPRAALDVALILGYNRGVRAEAAPQGIPVVFNMDGHRRRRDKWRALAPQGVAVRGNDWAACFLADHLIADHPQIERHPLSDQGRRISVIPYGADVLGTDAAVDLALLQGTDSSPAPTPPSSRAPNPRIRCSRSCGRFPCGRAASSSRCSAATSRARSLPRAGAGGGRGGGRVPGRDLRTRRGVHIAAALPAVPARTSRRRLQSLPARGHGRGQRRDRACQPLQHVGGGRGCRLFLERGGVRADSRGHAPGPGPPARLWRDQPAPRRGRVRLGRRAAILWPAAGR